MNTPELLEKLDTNQCISSRWIAQAAEKPAKDVHKDIRRILGMVHVVNHQTDSRGYTTEMWIELHDALYMMSQYNSDRAEKAKALVREAIRYFIHERPRMEARLAWLESDNAELAANQKRVSTEPKPVRVRRIYVPFLVATLNGIQIELRKRAKHECEGWQWEIGLVPWAVHAIETLQEKVSAAIVGGEHSLLQKFLPTEISSDESQLRELFEALTRDMCSRPQRYIKSRVEVLSA